MGRTHHVSVNQKEKKKRRTREFFERKKEARRADIQTQIYGVASVGVQGKVSRCSVVMTTDGYLFG
jgi:hypothetical protein